MWEKYKEFIKDSFELNDDELAELDEFEPNIYANYIDSCFDSILLDFDFEFTQEAAEQLLKQILENE